MRRVLPLLVYIVTVLSTETSGFINYCGSKICGHTNEHTFCQYLEGPGPECRGYMEARLSPEEKARVLARLNRRRSAAASGSLRGFPTAGDMLKLRWVEELACEAQLWADQCRPPRTPEENDSCRDLYSMSVGQCVASVVGEAPGLRPETMVDMWYMQNLQYKANFTYYEASDLNFYGDFAQMIWAHTYMVGCGRSRFMTASYGRMRSVERLVCNFAPRGPRAGRALWTPSHPATACPPRALPDADLPALCTFHHNYDPSRDVLDTMSLEEHLLLDTVLEMENKSSNEFGSFDELYLTKIAFATITDIGTTSTFYNSVQKRDIVDINEIIGNNYKVETNNKPGTSVNIPDPKISENTVVNKYNNKKLRKETESLVGRLKSYNIEELNDNKADLKNDNHDILLANMRNHEKDIYAEYEYSETIKENTTSSITTDESTALTENIEIIADNTVEDPLSKEFEYSITSTISSDLEMYSTAIANNVSKTRGNETAQKSVEDYLSDPETVRELQEELDRMEHTMSASSVVTSGKVRRELRGFPDDSNVNKDEDGNVEQTASEENHPQSTLEKLAEERNNTENRAPMLNMVFKYLPYLKDYGKNIKREVNHSSKTVTWLSPYILILALCFN